MAGFIKSLISGFAVSALITGATKMIASQGTNTAPQVMAPAMPQPLIDENTESYYEKRFYGTPGASLYTADALGVEAREAGIAGEVRVAQELERLAGLYPNTYVFHSVKLPGKMGDIDHIVIQGDTMLLVDSKNWKHAADYHIYHSTFEADYITRDGEDFTGGEVHLTRQIAEWQVEFMDSSLDVQAVLVIANRKSLVSESINAPYSFANISGLATIFGNLFTTEEAHIMHPLMLNRMLSLVQSVEQPAMTYAPQVRQKASTLTRWLVAWSFFNYSVMLLLFPLAGISAIPLLIVAHRQKALVKAKGMTGSGLLTAVLVFTYILLVGWAITISMVLIQWMKNRMM